MICNSNQPKQWWLSIIWYPAPELYKCHILHNITIWKKNLQWFPWEKKKSITGSEQSHKSSLSSSSSSFVLPSNLSIKSRSVLPEPMSRTCKLARYAKVLSSMEPTASRLNLKTKKHQIFVHSLAWKCLNNSKSCNIFSSVFALIYLFFRVFAFVFSMLPKVDALDVWSAFKCWCRNAGDAVSLQVNILQGLWQVWRDVSKLVGWQVKWLK